MRVTSQALCVCYKGRLTIPLARLENQQLYISYVVSIITAMNMFVSSHLTPSVSLILSPTHSIRWVYRNKLTWLSVIQSMVVLVAARSAITAVHNITICRPTPLLTNRPYVLIYTETKFCCSAHMRCQFLDIIGQA